jgi:hypothetical protein
MTTVFNSRIRIASIMPKQYALEIAAVPGKWHVQCYGTYKECSDFLAALKAGKFDVVLDSGEREIKI